MLQPVKDLFSEIGPKSQKNILTFHDYLPQFCSENRNWLRYKVVLAHFENWQYQCIYSRLIFPDIQYLFVASRISDF